MNNLQQRERKSGAELIAVERRQQVEKYGSAHDDKKTNGDLIRAAITYAAQNLPEQDRPDLWPWKPDELHPGDDVYNLVIAGALIAAEIDRLLRRQ